MNRMTSLLRVESKQAQALMLWRMGCACGGVLLGVAIFTNSVTILLIGFVITGVFLCTNLEVREAKKTKKTGKEEEEGEEPDLT